MSYVVLRARWCNIIILNVHVANQEKSDDSKAGLYEELDLASTLKCFTNLRKQLKYQRLRLRIATFKAGKFAQILQKKKSSHSLTFAYS